MISRPAAELTEDVEAPGENKPGAPLIRGPGRISAGAAAGRVR